MTKRPWMDNTIELNVKLAVPAQTHALHTSAAQSNQSCLYMTQRVQYVWVVQYSIFVYIETVKRITCMCLCGAWESECVFLFCSQMYKYVCIETKLRNEVSDFVCSSSFWMGSPQQETVFSFIQTLALVSFQMAHIYACMFTVARLAFSVSLPTLRILLIYESFDIWNVRKQWQMPKVRSSNCLMCVQQSKKQILQKSSKSSYGEAITKMFGTSAWKMP